MTGQDPKKFDPGRAHLLDASERERYLPTETVVDYGAGTGRLTVPVARAVRDGGRVIAVDSSDEMLGHLRGRLGSEASVDVLHVPDDGVPLPSGAADRVLAVNLLHEVRGEGALDEMRRLLADDGFALIVDWERGRPRDAGPPDDLLYDAAEARALLAAAGLDAVFVAPGLPYHFALIATPIT